MPRLVSKSAPREEIVVELETTTGTYISENGLMHHNCSECKKLHLLPDEQTPRVWKMSEVGAGYHKKGDPAPKVGGLHPHDRCTIQTLPPGYGFEGGRITYIGKDHDEFAKQRG